MSHHTPFAGAIITPERRERIKTRIDGELKAIDKLDFVSCYIIPDMVVLENYIAIHLTFRGPEDTLFSDKEYGIEFRVDANYPFKPPQAFFIGEAPLHPFYQFDSNDDQRPKRVTNLANTSQDAGGLYYYHAPHVLISDYVTKIRHSLTPAGEAEMDDYMMRGEVKKSL